MTVIHPDQKETFCGCVLFGRMLSNQFLTYPLSKTSYSLIRSLTALLAFRYHRPMQDNQDYGIRGIFAREIWNPGPWNPESHYLKPPCSALFQAL